MQQLIIPTGNLGKYFKSMKNKRKPKKMTTAQKYASLKRQTEGAGMKVSEKGGKLIVSRKKKK